MLALERGEGAEKRNVGIREGERGRWGGREQRKGKRLVQRCLNFKEKILKSLGRYLNWLLGAPQAHKTRIKIRPTVANASF